MGGVDGGAGGVLGGGGGDGGAGGVILHTHWRLMLSHVPVLLLEPKCNEDELDQ